MNQKLYIGQVLAATTMLMEAGGPVRVKEYRAKSISDEIRRQYQERRERNRQRLAREAAAQEAARARTPDHVWARIERDEKRRADKKAAKKVTKSQR